MKRFNWSDFLIALIVFVITFAVQVLLPMSPVLTWCCSIVHKIRLLGHDLVLFAIDHTTLTKFIISIIFFLITYFGKAFISEYRIKHNRNTLMLNHFEHSYKLVKNEMIPKMEKMIETNSKAVNNKMDRFIQSPIEYVNETVKGNQVPEFDADDTYQDVLFNENIKYIVAITAENPNLWMNPTLCFYMSNCYAASLIRHANKKTNKQTTVVIKNYEDLEEQYLTERKEVLDKLADLPRKSDLNDFQFVRFFLYDKNQRECCESAVFPSLKASQDLFRTVSFYVLKEKIQEEYYWKNFININNSIWDLFGDEKKSPVLKNRKEKTIPEFLVLFFDNHTEIHTYLDGGHKQINDIPGSEHYVGDSARNSFGRIKDLISYMAKFEKAKGDDLRDLDDKKKNKKYTFIDFVERE